MNSAAKNNLIAIKKTNTSKLVFYYGDFYVLFLPITQKLMPSEKFWFQIWNLHRLKEKSTFIFGYVHKVKFYSIDCAAAGLINTAIKELVLL